MATKSDSLILIVLFPLVCLFVLILPPKIQAQDPVYWQLTDEDGLPSMTVYQIIQDTLGYIWIGTANGLVRYDGREFKLYKHPKQADNEIMTLTQDAFGRIWYCNLSNQLFYIEKDSIYHFGNTSLRPPFKLISYIISDDFLVVNIKNINFSDSSLICHIPLHENLETYPFLSQNSTYGQGSHVTFIKQKGKVKIYTYNANLLMANGFSADESGITEIPFSEEVSKIQNMNGIAWSAIFSEYKRNSFTFFDNKLQFLNRDLNKKNIISLPHIINANYLLDNEIWILTKGGMHVGSIGRRIFLKSHIFKDFSLNHAFKDQEGNIWLATARQGIIVIPSMDLLNSFVSGKNLFTYSIVLDYQKNLLYSGHDNGIISILDNQKRISLNKKSTSKTNGRILEIIIRDKVYIATDGGLVFKKSLSSKKFQRIVKSGSVKNILIDKSNHFWIANNYSTKKIILDSLPFVKNYFLNSYEKILNIRTYALLEDFKGNIWLGSAAGIFQHRNNQIFPFLEKGTHIPYSVTDIIQTQDSSVWVTTKEDGLLKIKNDSIINRYSNAGHTNFTSCNALFEDSDNDIWIATSNGLFMMEPENEKFYHFDKFDGLPSNDILSIAVMDSIVWVGTPKGLVSFKKGMKDKNAVPPPIYITNFSIHEKDTTLHDNYQLKYNQNSFQIDFIGLGYRSRGEIKYKYQMLGIDTSWTTTDTPYARFPGLNPGKYIFNVVAINEDGISSKEPASLQFSISPPWYATWWFRTIIASGIIALGWLFFYLRYRNLREQEKMQHEFNEKVNELSMMALQTQMNPHFIFNSLNAIQQFLTTNDQENAMIFLAKFARLIRLVFDQSGKRDITLEEEIDFLKIYLSLESLRFDNTVEINFEVSEEVEQNQDYFRLPPLLIQPIIENAFKHGLFHKKQQKRLSIRFEKHNSFLKCTVTDNGIGRNKAKEINRWKSAHHKSSGLKTTKERLEILHKDRPELLKEFKFLTIIDLFDGNEARGTKVEILI